MSNEIKVSSDVQKQIELMFTSGDYSAGEIAEMFGYPIESIKKIAMGEDITIEDSMEKIEKKQDEKRIQDDELDPSEFVPASKPTCNNPYKKNYSSTSKFPKALIRQWDLMHQRYRTSGPRIAWSLRGAKYITTKGIRE